jgi:hypothetical protein
MTPNPASDRRSKASAPGYLPVPESETFWWFVVPLRSLTVNVAVRLPVAVGSNVTLMVQLVAGASGETHMFVGLKSPGSFPLSAMPVIVSEAVVLLFFTVTVFAALVVPTVWLANVSVRGVTVTEITPVPDSGTCCGLVEALSVITSVALSAPAADGANFTLMVQVFPAPSTEVQVVVFEKSPALGPA